MLSPIPPWHYGSFGPGSVPSPTPEPAYAIPIKPKASFIAITRGVGSIGKNQERVVQLQNWNDDVMDLTVILSNTISWFVEWTISDGTTSGGLFAVHSANNFTCQLPAKVGTTYGTMWLEFDFGFSGSYADPTGLVSVQAMCRGFGSTAGIIATYADL